MSLDHTPRKAEIRFLFALSRRVALLDTELCEKAARILDALADVKPVEDERFTDMDSSAETVCRALAEAARIRARLAEGPPLS